MGGGTLFFGDGNSMQINNADFGPFERVLDTRVRRRQFKHEYTYATSGTFVLNFEEGNRNFGVLNMWNSGNTRFYVETMVRVEVQGQCNDSPRFLVPPLDIGAVGEVFTHNPGAFDPDGDSLAYELETCKQGFGTPVRDYRFPDVYDAQASGGAATAKDGGALQYRIDSITGTLFWDAPAFAGEYNVAFRVLEYRKINGSFQLIGSVVRDMQIYVQASDNEPPLIDTPPDVCVEAGAVVSGQVMASDPNDDLIKVQAYGPMFEEDYPNPAVLDPLPVDYQPTPVVVDMTWNTTCQDVRAAPYEVQFRATDLRPPWDVELTAYGQWQIQVNGPAPTNVAVQLSQGTRAVLTWDRYQCANAEALWVYRKVESYDLPEDSCLTGIPANAGYERVQSLGKRDTVWVDTNEGEGLARGATYCYRLVAIFPEPKGGVSYASEEVCVTIEAAAPVTTKVSVEETGLENGAIGVAWEPPFDLDTLPYTYEVYRFGGLDGETNGTLVATTEHESLLDTALNTLDSSFHYAIVAYDSSGILLDTAAAASQVMLNLEPRNQAILLTWNAEVPWSNTAQGYPYHYIYRNRTDPMQEGGNTFMLLDSVRVDSVGFRYRDEGQAIDRTVEANREYCYWVVTQGTYGNPKTDFLNPLQNSSPTQCVYPNDTLPPCAIENLQVLNVDGTEGCQEFLANQPCDFSQFTNRITWDYPEGGGCQQDVVAYRVYYARLPDDEFTSLVEVPVSLYDHEGLPSFAGCYRVSAVDRSGNEGPLSEPVCRDNCPQYYLPDVFTVNGDSINETWGSLADAYWLGTGDNRCPRFARSVTLQVFNRWGEAVYSYASEPEESPDYLGFIQWNGQTNGGKALPEGVYYYQVEVVFEMLEPIESRQTFKGMVHLLR
ncbi:MAG TPA: hypothetical protein DCE41_11070 [Cytophagales bacterium]|nr:hypothetical protein [Cytophagales bacterium]